MFRFTIRDLLWLMVVVGLSVGWLADLDKIRRGRDALSKREAALVSENKRWRAEADRASVLQQDTSELNRQLMVILEGNGIDPREINNPGKMSRYMMEINKADRARIIGAAAK